MGGPDSEAILQPLLQALYLCTLAWALTSLTKPLLMGSCTAASQREALPDTSGTCVPVLPFSPVLLGPVAGPQVPSPLLSSVSR